MTPGHSVRLEATCEGTVLGESRRLHQAVVNLVANAVKYAPNGTTVDVRLTCSNAEALLVVEDRGPGVPESDREVVFERFTRLTADAEANRPGVGLGLYIVKRIVENHGGSVSVHNRSDGPGARFEIRLPLATREGNDAD